jgi:hypothetical protein
MGSQSPERLAWITLLGAFAIFLTLCGLLSLSAQWFLFSSSQNLASTVYVGRGTVGLRALGDENEEAVRLNRQVGRQDTLSTDEIAQGYLVFRDSSLQDRVVSTILLLPGSQIRLHSAIHPRFSFSTGQYEILLEDMQGRIEVSIPPALPQALRLQIQSAQGEVVLSESGVYLLWVDAGGLRLFPRGNAAELRPAIQDDFLSVQSGQMAQLARDQQTLSLDQSTLELVPNPLFLQSTDPQTPDYWGCYSLSERTDSPRGSFTLTTYEGRRSLFVQRGGGTFVGAGETGCRQFFGQEGLEVSGYSSLRLRATMMILWQSLAICGSQASECPLMVELSYLNEFGFEQRWIHGFYAFDHGNTEVPLACNSCLTNHERINGGSWYTFESANLLNLPEGFRPTRLLQIRFYISGHEYDVAISELSLLAER